MILYPLIKKILFRIPPEKAHYLTVDALKIALNIPGGKQLLAPKIKGEEKLAKTVAGLRFPNPIGLAAGFDKNAVFYEEMSALGFGFVEIGTVTPLAQEGNPQPRLFRLPKDGALINRMGFNNDGVDAAAERLKNRKAGLIIGGNIGKNKVTPNENAVSDYLICFEKLFPYVDYFVLNVSSPNTPNLRELQDKDALLDLLGSVQTANKAKHTPKPVFLKIAPDLSNTQIDEIIEIVKSSGIAGIIATNTTISRDGLQTEKTEVEEIGAGGLSGAPLQERSFEILNYLRLRLPKEIAIISSGGIMGAEEAKRRLNAGADLIQLYTGFIYEGPGLINRIKKALLK
jgi:dihydroorotate dehydrogenase